MRTPKHGFEHTTGVLPRRDVTFLLLALSFLEPVLDRRRSTLAHIHTLTPGQDNPTDLTDFAQCRWGLTASAICHRTLVLPLSLVLGSHAEQENFLLFLLPGLASLAVDLPPYPCERFIIRQSFCALLEAVECFCGSGKLLSRSLTRKAFFSFDISSPPGHPNESASC